MAAVACVLLLSLPLTRALALPRPPTPAATSIPAAKPLVVCTSAGSLEGLGFCRAAVSSGAYRVRALTRSLTSARTRQLEAIGAEIVVADNHDPPALEAAFAGAAAVYGITTWSGSTFAADGSVRRVELRAGRRRCFFLRFITSFRVLFFWWEVVPLDQ